MAGGNYHRSSRPRSKKCTATWPASCAPTVKASRTTTATCWTLRPTSARAPPNSTDRTGRTSPRTAGRERHPLTLPSCFLTPVTLSSATTGPPPPTGSTSTPAPTAPATRTTTSSTSRPSTNATCWWTAAATTTTPASGANSSSAASPTTPSWSTASARTWTKSTTGRRTA